MKIQEWNGRMTNQIIAKSKRVFDLLHFIMAEIASDILQARTGYGCKVIVRGK